MDSLQEALRLLKRQTQLENQLRQPGDVRITEERELYALRVRLQAYPAAVRAVFEASQYLHRPVDTLSLRDVENLLAAQQ